MVMVHYEDGAHQWEMLADVRLVSTTRRTKELLEGILDKKREDYMKRWIPQGWIAARV